MKTSIKKAVPYCCATCMAMVLLSSCISNGLGGYEQRIPAAVVADAGPDAVTPVGMAEETFETVAPEPTPIVTPKPIVYLAVSPVRTVTIEPTINEPIMPVAKETPKPAVVKREVAVAKKKSGLFGWLEKKKSRKATMAAYVPYSGPVPETNVAVKTKAKPVAVAPPKPVAVAPPKPVAVAPPKPVAVAPPKPVAANQAAVSKKKQSGIFGWMSKKKSGKAKSKPVVAAAQKPVVKDKPKQVTSVTPKPAVVTRRPKMVAKKKSSGDFINWLNQSR